jgi:SfnB family sulfur acquisition oxidoreductase
MSTAARSIRPEALPAPEIPKRKEPAHRIASDHEAIEVARVLAQEFQSGARERDQQRLIPYAEIDRFSRSGLWGITVPRSYGGAGVSAGTLAEVTAIISAADSNLGQIPQNHFYMVEAVRLGASEEQKRFYFECVLDGDRLGNAFSEIGTRSAADYRTTVTKAGDVYVLNGQKFYSTGSLFAHWIVVVAKNEDGRSTLVFLERGTPGLTIIDDWQGFGQRTTGSGTTRFDNIPVAPFAVVPHQDVFDRPSPMGPFAQIIHAAIDAGIARGALADAIAFTRKYARPWFETNYQHGYEDPYVISELGDLALRVQASDALLRRAARYLDRATVDPTDETVAEASVAVAEAKVTSTEVSVHVASKLFELTGSRSTLPEFGLDRHWRNARTHTLHDPIRYKYFNVGNYYLNGVKPPRHGAS